MGEKSDVRARICVRVWGKVSGLLPFLSNCWWVRVHTIDFNVFFTRYSFPLHGFILAGPFFYHRCRWIDRVRLLALIFSTNWKPLIKTWIFFNFVISWEKSRRTENDSFGGLHRTNRTKCQWGWTAGHGFQKVLMRIERKIETSLFRVVRRFRFDGWFSTYIFSRFQ